MADFIPPAEADHCPHCGAVLHDPPDCCPESQAEYDAELEAWEDVLPEPYTNEQDDWVESCAAAYGLQAARMHDRDAVSHPPGCSCGDPGCPEFMATQAPPPDIAGADYED